MNSRYAETTPDEDGEEESVKQKKLTLQEKAIFLEGDALQIEMGNIIMKTGTGGTILYDVARANQHKDRYRNNKRRLSRGVPWHSGQQFPRWGNGVQWSRGRIEGKDHYEYCILDYVFRCGFCRFEQGSFIS